MARIYSDYDISGTYGNLVVYRVGSRLYARSKSSLTGKRFLKDPAFARSRERSKQFGIAASLAKRFYCSLPKDQKCKGLFGRLTGFINKKLQEGKTKEAIIKDLHAVYGIMQAAMPSKTEQPIVPTPIKKQQSSQHLSNWQVTIDGLLEPITTSIQFYRQSIQIATTILILPDD